MIVVINEIRNHNFNIVSLYEERWPGNGRIEQKETTIFCNECSDIYMHVE